MNVYFIKENISGILSGWEIFNEKEPAFWFSGGHHENTETLHDTETKYNIWNLWRGNPGIQSIWRCYCVPTWSGRVSFFSLSSTQCILQWTYHYSHSIRISPWFVSLSDVPPRQPWQWGPVWVRCIIRQNKYVTSHRYWNGFVLDLLGFITSVCSSLYVITFVIFSVECCTSCTCCTFCSLEDLNDCFQPTLDGGGFSLEHFRFVVHIGDMDMCHVICVSVSECTTM